MKVLHISSSYPFSPLYKQLLMHFSNSGEDKHLMYVPVQSGTSVPQKHHYDAPNVQLAYSQDFTQLDRFFYHRKKRLILAAIERQVQCHEFQLTHAHFLFSAGGVALELKRRHQLNFLVAVRNTDLNVFFKYAFHLRRFGVEVLKEAAAIVFISPAYRDQLFEDYVPGNVKESLRSKSLVLPNGINDFWLSNRYARAPRVHDSPQVRLAYVGAFTRNKNVATTLQVVSELKRRGYEPHITLVGDGPDASRIRRMAARLGSMVTIYPWTDSQEQLLEIYRNADLFLMPSRTETFGLVYVEAMSQGLPVIYSRGQGIDGYFPDGHVGYRCDPSDVSDITDKVEAIVRDYNVMSARCTQSAGAFAWGRISSEYEEIYRMMAQQS